MTYNAKLNAEVKTAKFERKYVNAHTYHKVTVKRFHKAERKSVKNALKNFKG